MGIQARIAADLARVNLANADNGRGLTYIDATILLNQWGGLAQSHDDQARDVARIDLAAWYGAMALVQSEVWHAEQAARVMQPFSRSEG